MAKRANNEGSITVRKRDAKGRPVSYQGAVIIGYDDKTGKPIRKYYYAKTRTEVGKKIQDALYQLGKGQLIIPNNITLEDWLYRWLEDYVHNSVRPSTYSAYNTIVKVQIIPSLGKTQLAKIKGPSLQKFYNKKMETLSNRYVKHIHTVISAALNQAAMDQLISHNPAASTSPPKVHRKKFNILTEDELSQLLSATREDRLAPCYQLLVATGLRRGELLGLTWDAVDLDRGYITVCRQLLPHQGGIKLTDYVKSKSAYRSIPIPNQVVIALQKHKTLQAEHKLSTPNYNELNLVFTRIDGRPIDPRDFSKMFKAVIKATGLPDVRLHDVRHSHATLLLKMGIHPKVVQERLGHASIAITLDLYSHIFPDIQEAVAMSIDHLFVSKRSKDKKKPAN